MADFGVGRGCDVRVRDRVRVEGARRDDAACHGRVPVVGGVGGEQASLWRPVALLKAGPEDEAMRGAPDTEVEVLVGVELNVQLGVEVGVVALSSTSVAGAAGDADPEGAAEPEHAVELGRL